MMKICHGTDEVPINKYHVSFYDDNDMLIYAIEIEDFDERTAYIRACERFAASEGFAPSQIIINYERQKLSFPYESYNTIIINNEII